jgi:hypothetical protein
MSVCGSRSPVGYASAAVEQPLFPCSVGAQRAVPVSIGAYSYTRLQDCQTPQRGASTLNVWWFSVLVRLFACSFTLVQFRSSAVPQFCGSVNPLLPRCFLAHKPKQAFEGTLFLLGCALLLG